MPFHAWLEKRSSRLKERLRSHAKEESERNHDGGANQAAAVPQGASFTQPITDKFCTSSEEVVTGVVHECTANASISLPFTHDVIWRTAYDNLRSDDKKGVYVAKYEEIISMVFSEDSRGKDAPPSLIDGTSLGDSRLRYLVDKGLQNVKSSKQASDKLNNVVDIIERVEALIGIPLKNVSQTALPWAVVSSSLEPQYKVIFRTSLKLDDWEGDLKRISTREESFQKRLAQYKPEQLIAQVERLMLNTQDDTKVKEYHEIMSALRGIDPRSEMKNIEDRKDRIIRDVSKWALDTHEYKKFLDWDSPSAENLLWINGQAGTGKTMLLIGIIQELTTQIRRPEAPEILYFFFQNKDTQLDHGAALLRAFMWLLLRQCPRLLQHISSEYAVSGEKLFDDKFAFQSLSPILKNMLQDPDLGRVVLVADALDECHDNDQERVIAFLQGLLPEHKARSEIKVLVSGRPSWELENRFKSVRHGTVLRLDNYSLSEQINTYIGHRVRQLTHDGTRVPMDNLRKQLEDKSGNTFIWDSLICKELGRSPNHSWDDILKAVPKDLTDLYNFLLKRLGENHIKTRFRYCRDALCLVILTRRPLRLSEMSLLAGWPDYRTLSVVQDCRSFLAIQNDTVYPIHQTALEFLKDHYEDLQNAPPKEAHHKLFRQSLKCMRETLRQNVYNLAKDCISLEEFRTPMQDPLGAVRYSCRYWVYHLEQGGLDKFDTSLVYEFVTRHFLHWLEAMAFLGMISSTIGIIDALQRLLLKVGEVSKLPGFLTDGKRFILKNMTIASSAPLQLYTSALFFAPKASIVRTTFHRSLPPWIVRLPEPESSWGGLLRTLSRCSYNALAFSSDGQWLATSWENTVCIWETSTWNPSRSLEHTSYVRCVAFSQEQPFLAVGGEHTVVLWDTARWEKRYTVKHADYVSSIAVSQNGQLLAVASWNCVKVYDITKKAAVWSARSGTTAPSVAFCPGKNLLAFTSGGAIYLRQSKTGDFVRDVHTMHCDNVRIRFSSSGKIMGAFRMAEGIQVWNTETWTPVSHIDKVTQDFNFGMSLGHDDLLMEGYNSGDTVDIWEAATSTHRQLVLYQVYGPVKLSFSPAEQILAYSSHDGTVKLWDTRLGIRQGKPEKRERPHKDIVDRVVFSPGGRYVASRDWSGRIVMWDAEKGTERYHFQTTAAPTRDLLFSPDGRWLVSWASKNNIKAWNTQTGILEKEVRMQPSVRSELLFFVKDGLIIPSLDNATIVPELASLENLPTIAEFEIEHNCIVKTKSRDKIMWLPPEYYPRNGNAYAVHNRTIACGTASGYVHFLELAEE
ncbi:WD40 repeat-like protein [Aspergillus sclerotioniger CBS 115572]|uniref:WD40 repeat-like protein n=1 Tax=Aspergillus sclerotioniger CBS 115572 TaxID=1450535 RepID=A0A317X3D8_9EURO|nr:WD40 repeat-like protein [Aspergillus sclerotioniger CBS 115572]PWY93076.1 WD40 repeat-like protein [Aspergillus sclerotioniger CBS 115572]